MPLDISKAKAALRARLTATVFATTGTMALTATATGYTRETGSFIDDGFVPGLEVTPTGFPTNAVDVIKTVSALAITTVGAHTASAETGGRSLSVLLPESRAFDGESESLTPGRLSVRESFVHGGSSLITQSPDGGSEQVELTYIVTFFGYKTYGAAPIDAMSSVLLRRFKSGTNVSIGGQTVKVRAIPGPFAGQVLPHPTTGFLYRQNTVPCRASLRA